MKLSKTKSLKQYVVSSPRKKNFNMLTNVLIAFACNSNTLKLPRFLFSFSFSSTGQCSWTEWQKFFAYVSWIVI